MMDLIPILEDLGIDRLKQAGDEVTGICPVHEQRVGHVDHSASWSINTESGAFQCFSCGFKGRSLAYLYESLTGNVPDYIHKMTQLAEIQHVSKKLDDAFSDSEPESVEMQVGTLVPVPRSLLDGRNLVRDSAEALGVRWDRDAFCWYVPVITPKGDLIGAQVKQAGTFLNIPANVEKSTTLFGYHAALKSKTVAVVESPLDVVRLHGVGVPAVSTFGSSVSDEQIALLRDNWIRIVLWMDNDEAGEKSTGYLKYRLRDKAVLVVDYEEYEYTDPGEYKYDEELKTSWNQTLNPFLRIALTR